MRARALKLLSVAIGLALVLALGAQTQGLERPAVTLASPPNSPWPTIPGGNLPAPGQTLLGAGQVPSANPSIALGPSGLSFRYAQTYGQTGVPYLDTGGGTHLNFPYGLAADGNSIWIAEGNGLRVLKYSSTDSAAPLLQIGQGGRPVPLDGRGLTFGWPADIAIHGGYVWVADGGANLVLKFDSSGHLAAILGEGPGLGDNQFNDPLGIAFDGDGNLYVSDSHNHRVQVFGPDGVYAATIGETGAWGSDNGHFNRPGHIAIDADRRLYIADSGNHRVQVFDVSSPTAPVYVATIGVSGQRGSDNSHLANPQGIGLDAGRLYVADSGNHRVQVFDRDTLAWQRTLGSGSPGSTNQDLNWPADVAVDSAGNIYVAEGSRNSRVQQFSHSFAYTRTYGTTGVPYLTDGAHFYRPAGVAAASDGLLVAENRGQRLLKLNATGAILWAAGEAGVRGDDNAHFSDPVDLALDAAGRIYLADAGNNRVQIINPNGTYAATLGIGFGPGQYQFRSPSGVAVDGQGCIYVTDTYNFRVQVYDSDRSYLATLGVTGQLGSDNAHFWEPAGVAVDRSGNVYVADRMNHRVQKCIVSGSGGTCTTFAGQTDAGGNDFGHLNQPVGIAVDANGLVYVAEELNHRVQVFSPSGAYLTTIGGASGSSNGQLQTPKGLALDGSGGLLVADAGNHRIQRFQSGVPGWVQANVNGFGNPWQMISALGAFGSYLYAGTWSMDGAPAQIWRTADGRTWNQVTPAWSSAVTSVFAVQGFGPYLYVGTNGANGGEVWRTDGAGWQAVVSGGFGDNHNDGINAFAVFGDYLYAAVSNSQTGLEVWRSATGSAGSWSQVNADGFGSGGSWDDVVQDVVMETSGSYLYVGLGRNGRAELWRTRNGSNWGPVFANGLGNDNNTRVSALASFRGGLCAGLRNTVDGGEVWCSGNGLDNWERKVAGGLGNPSNTRPYGLVAYQGQLYLAFGNADQGAQVWSSVDGDAWQPIVVDGWGDASNMLPDYFDKSAAEFGGGLYFSTWNFAHGGEVWRMIPQVYLPLVTRSN